MALYIEHADLMVYHVPKCGGTWVCEALSRWGVGARRVEVSGVSSQHSAPIHHPWHTGPRLVFLRDPVTWYRSWWRYQMSMRWPSWEPTRWHPCRGIDDQRGTETFAEWVDRMTRYDSPLTTLYGYYVGSFSHPREGWSRTRVEAFEDISDALYDALVSYGVPLDWCDVPPVNVTPGIDLGGPGDRGDADAAIRRAEHPIYERFEAQLWGGDR